MLDAVSALADKAGDTAASALAALLRLGGPALDDALAASPFPEAAPEAASPGGRPRSRGRDAPSPQFDDAASRLLRLLLDHRKACERDARYADAQAASSVLCRLQGAAERAGLGAMRARHAAQKQDAADVHARELADHNAVWDSKSEEYESLVAAQLDKLAASVAAREAELDAELTARAPRRLQPSKELLALRSKQEALGRQGKYTDAAAVQKTADRLEAAEVAAARDAFAAESSRLRGAAAAKAASDRSALLHRAARGREQLRCARAADKEQCVQRYRNALAALDSLHRREAVAMDVYLSTQQLAGKRVTGAAGSALPKSAHASANGSPGGSGASPSPGNGVSAGSPFGKSPKSGGKPRVEVATGVAALRSAVARKSAGSIARAVGGVTP